MKLPHLNIMKQTLITVLTTAILTLSVLAKGQYEAQALATYEENYDLTSSAADELFSAIMAQEELSIVESGFVLRKLTNGALGNRHNHSANMLLPEWQSAIDQVAAKCRRIVIEKKYAFRDNTGWTDEDIIGTETKLPEAAQRLALYGSIKDPFVARVILFQKGQGFVTPEWKELFKNYRQTLSISDQIALTKTEISGLTNIVRNEVQDAWLESLAFDLVILKSYEE